MTDETEAPRRLHWVGDDGTFYSVRSDGPCPAVLHRADGSYFYCHPNDAATAAQWTTSI